MIVAMPLRAVSATALVSASVLGAAPAAGAATISPRPRPLPARPAGPVILMHNQPIGNPATVAALPVIIRYFQHRHYRFVRL